MLVVKPQDLSLKVNELSEKIIACIMSNSEMEIIGLSGAVFLACSAVNMASDIANVHVNEVSFGYVEFPILGTFETVFIKIGTKPEIDVKERVEEEEKGMNLSTEREGQLITVRRGEKIERLITLCLIKFQRTDKLKLIAAATAINDAVSLALKLTEGQVAKDPIGISFVGLHSLPSREDPLRKMTGISIYLKKGNKTVQSHWHKTIIERMRKQTHF
jgi:hypothetical protein